MPDNLSNGEDMKKIVIAGASVYGLSNISDDSMFSVFCRELHKNIPNLEITLLARHPSEKLDKLYDLHSMKNLDHNNKNESMGRWFMGLNPGDSQDHLFKIWNAIKNSDLLISGGDPFIDITIGLYKGISPYTALLMTLAKFLGKPVMLHGIHIGRPLQTEVGREISRFCISNAKLITIREEDSRKLIMDLGVESTDNIISLADTSYGLDPVKSKEKGIGILENEGIKLKSKKIIGITFRHMYWKWGKAEWEYYSSIMAELCDYMIERFNVDLLFIPHCFYNVDHPYEDDRPAAKEIIFKMKNKENTHRIKEEYDLYDILS